MESLDLIDLIKRVLARRCIQHVYGLYTSLRANKMKIDISMYNRKVHTILPLNEKKKEEKKFARLCVFDLRAYDLDALHKSSLLRRKR